MKSQEDLAALAQAIVRASNADQEVGSTDRYADDYGPESEPDHARMFGVSTWPNRSVGFSDYVLTLAVHPDDGYLLVGTVPQSRDYYGGPLRMEWSDGWQEKVDDEYLGIDEIAAWIVRAVDY